MKTSQKLKSLFILSMKLRWWILGVMTFGVLTNANSLSVSETYAASSLSSGISKDESLFRSWTNAVSRPPGTIGDLKLNVGSCDGHSNGLGLGIKAPTPPQSYDLPPEANAGCVDAFDVSPGDQPSCVIVHNAVQLQEQVVDTQSKLLILEDGEYDAEDLDPPYPSYLLGPQQRFLKLNAGHRLWARNLGKVILHFGIDLGGNGVRFAAPELHGLVLDIQNAQHGAIHDRIDNPPTYAIDEELGLIIIPGDNAAPTRAILIWGDARDAVIEDTQLYGHKYIERGIEAANKFAADGLQVRRMTIDGFSRLGILIQYCDKDDQANDLQCNNNSVEIPVVAEDVDVRNIGGIFDNTDLSENEHVGITLGAPGRLSRARVRDVTRVGIATQGTMDGGVLEDLDVDRIGVGTHFVWGKALYIENTTVETEFRRFCVGSSVQVGLVSEWDNCAAHLPKARCFPRGIDNTVRDGLIQSYFIGINFDQGTTGGHIENVTFRNAAKVGIVMHENVDSIQINNTFDLPAGSCPVTNKVWNAKNPCDFMPWQTWQ